MMNSRKNLLMPLHPPHIPYSTLELNLGFCGEKHLTAELWHSPLNFMNKNIKESNAHKPYIGSFNIQLPVSNSIKLTTFLYIFNASAYFSFLK
jgi:hypothetical protein